MHFKSDLKSNISFALMAVFLTSMIALSTSTGAFGRSLSKTYELPESIDGGVNGMKAAGGRMYAPNKNGQRIFVIEKGVGLVTTIEFDEPGGLISMVPVPQDNYMYVTIENEKALHLIETEGNLFLMTVDLPFAPVSIALNADMESVTVVSATGEYAVINRKSGETIGSGTVPSAGANNFLSNGETILIWNSEGSDISIYSTASGERKSDMRVAGGIVEVESNGAETCVLTDSNGVYVFDSSGALRGVIEEKGAGQITLDESSIYVQMKNGSSVNVYNVNDLALSENITGGGAYGASGSDGTDYFAVNGSVVYSTDNVVADIIDESSQNFSANELAAQEIPVNAGNYGVVALGPGSFGRSPLARTPYVYLYKSDGDGTFSPLSSTPVNYKYQYNYISSLTLNDYDDDYSIDFTYNYKDAFAYFAGESAPSFSYELILTGVRKDLLMTASGDFDNDGDEDYVVVPYHVVKGQSRTERVLKAVFFRNSGYRNFDVSVYDLVVSGQPIGVTYYYYDMESMDVDRDGNLDIVLSSFWGSSYIYYMGGNGDGTFTINAASLISGNRGYNYPAPIAVADFDMDGYEDIASLYYDGKMRIAMLKNLGNGQFEQHAVFDTGLNHWHKDIDAYDFNGDRLPDMLASPDMWLYSNQGNWTFEKKTDTELPGHFSIAVPSIRKSALFMYAAAGDDQEGVVGWPVKLDAGASSGAGTEITDYAWDFGDGETGSGAQVEHIYAAAGEYEVTLTITDELGRVAKDTLVAFIRSVEAGPNRTIMEGDSVYLFTPVLGGASFVYTWDTGDGYTYDASAVTHQYDRRGVYEAVITASAGSTAAPSPVSTLALSPTAFAAASGDSDSAFIRVLSTTPPTEYAVVSVEVTSAQVVSGPDVYDTITSNHNHLFAYTFDSGGHLNATPPLPFYIDSADYKTNAVTLEDFDGDGDYDFIVSGNDRNVYIYFDDSDNSVPSLVFPHFTKKLVASFPQLTDMDGKIIPWESRSAGAEDFDGDGDMDFAFYTQYHFYTFLNDGYGHFSVKSQNPGYNTLFYGLDAGDMNGDGFADIVAANKDQLLYFPGDGKGNWNSAKVIANVPSGMKNPPLVRAADFNGDGTVDVAMGGSGAKLYTYINGGGGVFIPGAVVNTGITTSFMGDVYDADADGVADLLISGGGSSQMYSIANGGDANFASTFLEHTGINGKPFGIAAPPLHFAGQPNEPDEFVALAMNASSQNGIYLSAIQPGFPPGVPVAVTLLPGSFLPGGKYSVSPVADLDNDGDLDFLVMSWTTGSCSVSAFMNNGAARFYRTSVFSSTAPCDALQIADLDSDLRPDAMLRVGDDFIMLINDGSASFSSYVVTPVNYRTAHSFELADINNDGYVDIVAGFVVNTAGIPVAPDVFVMYGLAPGAPGAPQGFDLTPTVLIPVPFGAGGGMSGYPSAIIAEDFNGDGSIDIAVGSDHVTGLVYLNDGMGAFNPAPSLHLDFSLGETGAAVFRKGDAMDADGDGVIDLLLTAGNYSGLNNSLPAGALFGYMFLKGHGNGSFDPPAVLESGVRYDSLGAAVPNLIPRIPDLVAHRIEVLPSSNPQPLNNSITIRAYVRNAGIGSVPPVTSGAGVPVRVRVVFEGSDIYNDVMYIPAVDLAAGDEAYVSFPLAPDQPQGLYLVELKVDMDGSNLVSELDEMGNNEKVTSFIVGAVESPDFIDVSCGLNFNKWNKVYTISGHAQYSMDWTPPELASNNAVTISLWKEGEGFVSQYRWSALDGLNLYTNGSGDYSWNFGMPTSGGLYTAFVDVFDGSVHGYCDESFVVPEQENLALRCRLFNETRDRYVSFNYVSEDTNLRVDADVYNTGYEDVPAGIPLDYTLTDITNGASTPLTDQSTTSPSILAPGDKWRDDLFTFSMNDRNTCYNVKVEANAGQSFMNEARMTDNVCNIKVCRLDSPDIVAQWLYSYDPVDVGGSPFLQTKFYNRSYETEDDFRVEVRQVNKDGTELLVAEKTVPPPMARNAVDATPPSTWPAPGGGAWTVPAGDVVKYLQFTVDADNDIQEGWWPYYATSGYHENNNVIRLYPPDVFVRSITPLASTCVGTPISSNYPMGGFRVSVGHADNFWRMLEGDYTVVSEVFYQEPSGTWTSILKWNDVAHGNIIETLSFPKTGTLTMTPDPAYVGVDTAAGTVTLVKAGNYKIVSVADPNAEKLDEKRANNTLTNEFKVEKAAVNLSAWRYARSRMGTNASYYYGYQSHYLDIQISGAPTDWACQADVKGGVNYTNAAYDWTTNNEVVAGLPGAGGGLKFTSAPKAMLTATGFNAGTAPIPAGTPGYWVKLHPMQYRGHSGFPPYYNVSIVDKNETSGIDACSWPEKGYELEWGTPHGAMQDEGGDRPGKISFEVDYKDNITNETREDDNDTVLYFNDMKMTTAAFTPPNPFYPGSPGTGKEVTFRPTICVEGHMPMVDWRVEWRVNYVKSGGGLGAQIDKGWTDIPGFDYTRTDNYDCATYDMTNWGEALPGGGVAKKVMMPEFSALPVGVPVVTDAQGRRGYWIRLTLDMDVMRCVPEKYELNNEYTKDFFVHESLPNLTPWRDASVWRGHAAHYTDVELVVTPSAAPGAPDCVDTPVQDGATCAGIRAIVRNTGEKDATGVRALLIRKNSSLVDFGNPPSFNLSANASMEVVYNQWYPASSDKSLKIRVIYSGTEMNPNDNETEREIPDINLYDVKPD